MVTVPRVTVLLTSYNRGAWLRRAIRSVLDQTLTDFELIVLDDNSPPGSGVAAVLARIKDPRVWVLSSRIPDNQRHELNRYAVMLNRGLALARGEFITYLCDDDWYYPHRLAVLAAALDEHHDKTVVYGPQLVIDADGNTIGIRPADRVLADAAFVVDHCSVMHKASIWQNVGGWDEDPAGVRVGDARFWRRLTNAGHLFHPAQGDPLDVNVQHPGQMGAPLTDEQLIADRLNGRIV